MMQLVIHQPASQTSKNYRATLNGVDLGVVIDLIIEREHLTRERRPTMIEPQNTQYEQVPNPFPCVAIKSNAVDLWAATTSRLVERDEHGVTITFDVIGIAPTVLSVELEQTLIAAGCVI